MRWLLVAGLALVAALSLLAVIISITSVSAGSDLERIVAALRLQTGCSHIVVRHPSRASLVGRWRVQTADISCPGAAPGLIYARFGDGASLREALIADPLSRRYCVLGNVLVIDPTVGPSTLLSDVCQSVGGTLVTAG